MHTIYLHGGDAFAILDKAGQTVSKSDCDFIDACRDTAQTKQGIAG